MIFPLRILSGRAALTAAVLAAASGCAEEVPRSAPASPSSSATASARSSQGSPSSLVRLLADREVVFGVFSGEKSRAGGAAVMEGPRADFQLYSMESGPFDVATMEEYIRGMTEAGGGDALADFPIVVRTPSIDDQPDSITGMVRSAMAAGASGIVFPHVESAQEAARATVLLGRPFPIDPAARAVNMIIVESQEGVANLPAILQTSGLSVVFAGPGSLRSAYNGDMVAVEEAIQTVLTACLDADTPCGITAGAADIVERLDQGFEVIIATEPEAVAIGMEQVGRN